MLQGNYQGNDATASKKERIAALLESGSVTYQEIARKENTSVEYVRKIKCLLRKPYTRANTKSASEGRTAQPSFQSKAAFRPTQEQVSRNDQASIRPATVTEGEFTSQSTANANKRHKYQPSSSHLQQQLTEDQRKALWADFESGMNPVDVIIKYGYTPLTVQEEYLAYLEFKNIDLTQSQTLVTRWLEAHEGELEKRPDDQ